MKADGQLNIHSENILPIIKKWLYSEKDIFIRELAANAADAIQKLHILHAQGQASHIPEPRIEIRADKEKKTLTFSDTGLGLDAEEAERFLAQIAFSGAEEFMKTYQLNDTFIGHFGLGFFSAFIVAEQVEVSSLSYKEGASPIVWSSDGSVTYSIADGERSEVGTDVILHVQEEHLEYLDETKLRQVVSRFCSFFPYPVYVNGTHINEHEPLWQKRPQDCTEEEYKAFYRVLYPFDEPPLFWIHLNVDYPFHVQGILYFPKIRQDLTLSKDHVKLFCNRVFVSDDCKDVLPEYLSLLRGVLESPDIPLNVSRSYLQVDQTVRQLGTHIAKKVVDALSSLQKNDQKRFEECWQVCELVIKLGMLQDEKFYTRAKDLLLFKRCQGGYTRLQELADQKTIVYCEAGQEQAALTTAYLEKDIDVLVMSSPLDHPLMSRLEKDHEYKFKRTDAALDATLEDPTREKTLLDASGKTEAAHIADFFRAVLKDDAVDVQAKSIDASFPALLTLSEEERRFRDYMTRVSGDATALQPQRSLIVNTNSPLVQAVYKVQEKQPELANEVVRHIWDLTCLTHHELPPAEMQEFIDRSTRVLAKLTSAIP